MVRVRWGSSLWYSRGRCCERGRRDKRQGGQFGWVGITDEEVVNNKGKRGGVGVVAEKHGGGGFGVAVLGQEGDKTKLRQEAGLGKARDSL